MTDPVLNGAAKGHVRKPAGTHAGFLEPAPLAPRPSSQSERGRAPEAKGNPSIKPVGFASVAEAFGKKGVVGYEESRAVLATPVEFMWRDVIAVDHVVEVCGPSASGKSSLMFQLIAARANPTGKPVKVLGREVTPAPDGRGVLLANEENGRQSAIAGTDAAIEMLGLPLRATWERIALLPRAGLRAYETDEENIRHLQHGDTWGAIHKLARDGAFAFIVLDTRARIFAGFGDPNSEEAQAAAASEVQKLVTGGGQPVAVVSHSKKGGGSEIEDISGSAQRGGAADVVLMVNAEKSGGRVLSSRVTFAKLRDCIGEHPEPVTFSIGRSEGAWWVRVREDGEGENGEPAHERIRELLCDGRALTKNKIREALKCSGATVVEGIAVLRAERRIRETTKRIAGREQVLYAIAETFEEMGLGKSRRGKEA